MRTPEIHYGTNFGKYIVSLIVNIGMISGILPVVGVPLPFFSYGGSSMVVSLISIGIIMNLYSNKSLIAN